MFKRIRLVIKNNIIKRKIILTVVLFVVITVVLSLMMIKPVYAQDGNPLMSAIAMVLGWIAYFLSYVIGLLLSLMVGILVEVAQYNKIIDVEAVKVGWVMVRDLCNMFFVLILLVIAFAAILRIESYPMKKLLPKLLIMAVLINFSKTICGLIIDFSQVIMLTFVNSFALTGAGRFVDLFQIDKYLSFKTYDEARAVGGLVTAGAILAGLIAMIITLVVVTILTIVLVMRVVLLWVYVILSPVAFLSSAFPAGQKYSSQWWSSFTKQVVIGPVLAFFLWLALLTAHKSAENFTFKQATGTQAQLCAGENALFCSNDFQTYLITIALLIGGLMVAQQMGGFAGSIAGSAVGKIKAFGIGAARLPFKGAKEIGSWGLDKISGWAGVDLNVARGYKRVQAQMAKHKSERALKIYGKALETTEKGGRIRGGLAHLSTGDLAWRSITNWYRGGLKPVRRAVMGGKWAVKDKEINDLKEQRKNIWTKQEKGEQVKQMSQGREKLKTLDEQIEEQDLAVKTAPDKDKDKEVKKKQSLENERNSLKDQISSSLKEIKGKRVDDNKAKNLDGQIEKYTDRLDKYRIEGLTEARVSTQAALESEQGKVLATIDNADEIGRILRDALKNGQQGLVAAAAKKMTRVGDYNELMKQQGLGTGREGLQRFAQILQTQGGFSKQAALGLVGEMGGIAKNIQHYAAYGTVKMENGRWTEASQDDYDIAQLAEMLKIQPQAFARNVNRLGLGSYDGPDQRVENWRPSRAAIQYIKLNADTLAEQYKRTGQQNAIEHLAANIDDLKNNNVSEVVLTVLDERAGGEADPAALIKSTRAKA